MGSTRKNLRTSSVIVLALAFLSLINILFELFFGELSEELKNAVLSGATADNLVLITQIFVLVVSALMLLPEFYIGFKGLKMAKYPDSSVGHIIWGIILIIFTAYGLLSTFLDFIKGNGQALVSISEMLSVAVDLVVLIEYVKFARAVRKGA